MAHLSERQDVLSQNIANVDTPGYKPKDLKELEFKDMVRSESNRLQLRATSPDHQSSSQRPAEFRTVKMKTTYEHSPMKNHVVVEEQMMKVAETKLQYDMTTNLYKKMSDMFKTAIGNR
ncbi:MAG: flagellar basal body rod protein FlgB [Alphaproteobacteria bacterium]|nr:flagellar basal body rod protein FlgB [Alphaproteobacteria bacterium]